MSGKFAVSFFQSLLAVNLQLLLYYTYRRLTETSPKTYCVNISLTKKWGLLESVCTSERSLLFTLGVSVDVVGNVF